MIAYSKTQKSLILHRGVPSACLQCKARNSEYSPRMAEVEEGHKEQGARIRAHPKHNPHPPPKKLKKEKKKGVQMKILK